MAKPIKIKKIVINDLFLSKSSKKPNFEVVTVSDKLFKVTIMVKAPRGIAKLSSDIVDKSKMQALVAEFLNSDKLIGISVYKA